MKGLHWPAIYAAGEPPQRPWGRPRDGRIEGRAALRQLQLHLTVVRLEYSCFAFITKEHRMSDIGTMYLDAAFRSLRGHKRLADDAISQLSDEQFFAVPDDESNSVAIIVKHMAGNMRSRFTDFLTTDGEKPDRNRDQEFMPGNSSRAEILALWEKHWTLVFDTINGLSGEDLTREVTIRNEPHSVLQAINRQVAHSSYHVGQIVFLAKHWKGKEWKTLTIARGQSAAVNTAMAKKHKPR
jgi:uncharacterized damage-inducible protein DinB